jgi:hypothetical protein
MFGSWRNFASHLITVLQQKWVEKTVASLLAKAVKLVAVKYKRINCLNIRKY